VFRIYTYTNINPGALHEYSLLRFIPDQDTFYKKKSGIYLEVFRVENFGMQTKERRYGKPLGVDWREGEL